MWGGFRSYRLTSGNSSGEFVGSPVLGQLSDRYGRKAILLLAMGTTTAGNLVFTGTPEGYLKAFDARTGEELYKFNTGTGIVGTPVTWEMDGEQYVSVASGWGGAVPLWGGEVGQIVKDFNQGGMVWTFKLPSSAGNADVASR